MKKIVFMFCLLFVIGCTTSAETGAARTLDNANSAIGSVADSVSGKIWVPRGGAQSAPADEKKDEKNK